MNDIKEIPKESIEEILLPTEREAIVVLSQYSSSHWSSSVHFSMEEAINYATYDGVVDRRILRIKLPV